MASGGSVGGVVHELMVAAAKGDCLQVDRILGDHPHLIEAANEWGWTVLMQAASGGHRELAVTLLIQGADVTAVNKLGMNVLNIACATGDQRMVQLLMEHGARGHAAAVSAIAFGHTQLLPQIVTSQEEANQVLKISGSSPLHLAVAESSADAVQKLIFLGANPNLRDQARQTALDLAEQFHLGDEMSKIVRMLKEISECKLSTVWSEGVVESSRVGDLRQLMVSMAEMSTKCMLSQDLQHSHSQLFSRALLAASENGHALALEILLRHQLNINIFGPQGMTPLMLAATNGHLDVAERLLEAGADCRLKSSVSGHTAFELASLSDDAPPELARLLAKSTILNAEAAPLTPQMGRHGLRKWPLSPQPPHRLLQLPKSPHRPSSLPGSPTFQRSLSEPEPRRSTPRRIKHFLSCISNKFSKKEEDDGGYKF